MRRTGTYDGYRRCDPCHRRSRAGSLVIAAAGLLVFASYFVACAAKAGNQRWRSDRSAGRFGARRLRKADIKIIRITEFRRIGRKVRLLEIDTTDDRLFVLTRWDLGTDPLDVLDALTAAGLARRLAAELHPRAFS